MQTLIVPVLLACIVCLSAAAAEGQRGRVWPKALSARIAKVAVPPDLDAEDPLSDPAWREAEVIGPLFAKIIQAAFEFANLAARAAPPFGKNDQRIVVADFADHQVDGALMDLDLRAIDQDGVENLGRAVVA